MVRNAETAEVPKITRDARKERGWGGGTLHKELRSLRVTIVLGARGDKIEKLSYFLVKIRGVLATNAPIFHQVLQGRELFHLTYQLNLIPTGTGGNQPIYEYHGTTACSNKVNICTVAFFILVIELFSYSAVQ